ncbi:cobalamin biosynthesis protein CobW [Marinobacter nanhaiticus D15-8W]|uniref:Cobalamin biosynthesis protein CobW n=1 Tax=Marinobacter nanhaiticus D15-8W TaxID=626887 RepID=N6WRH9_9GAMM|nr:cobalamin biosynthesis protein CobW [Marinobacter nanhaiticus]ENO14161.1 cobalamin biosynthesis protein CobW [Marinobacter nanhaiticus D15-8W]BES71545.1 cobalamin biosynthesis protein CobW [Marinobacter nanhaiticus D15-8W]
MQLNKIPATVVTGFLGSGKTTLLASILRQVTGKRIAVIVNEFGEQDIDSDVLRSCSLGCEEGSEEGGEGKTPIDGEESGVYELANGCICCTVEEEFLPVMKKLVERRDQIDHILIETSGLALPKPLVQAFNWPDVRQHCTVDAIITVVDGPAVAAGRYAADVDKVEAQRLADENLDHDPSLKELLDDQLGAADLVIVSKTDLLSEKERKRVEDVVQQRVPASVKTLFIDRETFADDSAKLEALMGIAAASEETIDEIENHHDRYHAEGAHHDHAHDHFDSCVITLGEVDGDRLAVALQQLLKDYRIYRAKGFAALPGKPMRQVVQAVGKRLDTHFDRLWGKEEARRTQLVIIGRGFDPAKLKDALTTAETTAA